MLQLGPGPVRRRIGGKQWWRAAEGGGSNPTQPGRTHPGVRADGAGARQGRDSRTVRVRAERQGRRRWRSGQHSSCQYGSCDGRATANPPLPVQAEVVVALTRVVRVERVVVGRHRRNDRRGVLNLGPVGTSVGTLPPASVGVVPWARKMGGRWLESARRGGGPLA